MAAILKTPGRWPQKVGKMESYIFSSFESWLTNLSNKIVFWNGVSLGYTRYSSMKRLPPGVGHVCAEGKIRVLIPCFYN